MNNIFYFYLNLYTKKSYYRINEFLAFPALIILMKSPTDCPGLALVNPAFPRLGAAGRYVPAGSALHPAAHFPHSITYPLGSTAVAHQNKVLISFTCLVLIFLLDMLPPKEILEPASSLISNSVKKSCSFSSLGAGPLSPKLGTTATYL